MRPFVSMCLLLALSASQAIATRIDSVCTAVPSASGMARPQIPDTFRVMVECSMQEQNRTIVVEEYFDYGNNKGRIKQTDLYTNADAFFDYNNNELIMLDLNNNFCEVEDLSKSDNRWMFGYKNKVHGQPHIFGASGALHFGDSPEEYIGQKVIRGILVHQWDSCQYSEDLNATMKVSWYFSSKTEWDMQLGARAVPIRATAVGQQYYLGQIRPFNHTYDLYRFEPFVHPDDFEIPEGVVCPGRIRTKAFPQIPNRFSFNGEIIDSDRRAIAYLEESYDNEAKINVFRYKRQEDISTLTSIDRMLQVNDYNSGVSYIIDTIQGSCQVTQLGFGGYAFVKYLNHGKVQMKTPAEFFQDGSVQYTYSGVRYARDIPCEVWVAKTDKIQGYTDRNLTIEWYFALSSDDESWNTEGPQWRLPIEFRMWESGEQAAIWDFNVYYYDFSRPRLIGADVSACFHGVYRRRFTFDIAASARDDVFNNLEMFKYALTSAVSLFCGISQVRVADIEVYYDTNVIRVSFDMLDKPNIGGDVANMTRENDLNNAVKLYNDVMNLGKLQLSVVVGTNVKTVIPLPGSSRDNGNSTSPGSHHGPGSNPGSSSHPGSGSNPGSGSHPGSGSNPGSGSHPGSGSNSGSGSNTGSQISIHVDNSGYTGGALAGLGIGMLLVGSAGGAGAAFFFFK